VKKKKKNVIITLYNDSLIEALKKTDNMKCMNYIKAITKNINNKFDVNYTKLSFFVVVVDDFLRFSSLELLSNGELLFVVERRSSVLADLNGSLLFLQ